MVWFRKISIPLFVITSIYLVLTHVTAAPFFYLALSLAIIFLVATFLARSSIYKAIFWNLAFFMILFGSFEAYYAGWNILGVTPPTKQSRMTKYLKKGPYAYKEITGPKYQMDSTGHVHYVGKFNNTLIAKFKYEVLRKLNESYFLENIGFIRAVLGPRTEEDTDTFIQIIVRSSKLFTNKYHGKFYVILLGINDKERNYVLRELRRNKVEVIQIEEIIKDFNDYPEKYAIVHDGHPNKLYNQKLTEYLLAHLKKNNP